MQIEESAGTPNKFIVLRQEVLYDKNLSMAEKFVYARMCQFDEYFESCEEAGNLLGIAPETVKKAKQKLVKLGYAEELANTGRGKRYQIIYDIRREENTRETGKIYPSDGYKMPDRRVESTRRVKEIEKKEYIVDSKLSTIGENAEHGNPDINDMFAMWKMRLGFEQKPSQANRRACYNLLRRKDVGRDNLVKLIMLVDEATEDRFAPKEVRSIIGFATLQQNLPNLMMWAKRKYSQVQAQMGIEI